MVARVVVVVLGIPVVVGLVLAGGVYFLLGVEGTLALMLWEYARLARRKGIAVRLWSLLPFGLSLPAAAYLSNTIAPLGLLVVLGVAFDLTMGLFERQQWSPFASSGAVALGLTYVAFPMATLILLRGFGWRAVAGAFALIFVNDILAFLVGTRLGRHKLLPRISPKKSVEGAIGGLLGTLGAALVMARWQGFATVPALLLGAVVCAAGILGDFVESSLKRDADVKDSGGLLPGHGGFLDRFDSTLFVMPIVYVVLSLLVRP